MPDPVFVKINSDLDLGELAKEELSRCREDSAQCVTAQDSRYSQWFGAGILLGIVTTISIQQIKR